MAINNLYTEGKKSHMNLIINSMVIGDTLISEDNAIEINTKKAFLLPRLTVIERNDLLTPQNGMLIYNTDTNLVEIYSNGIWESSSSFTTLVGDVNGPSNANIVNTVGGKTSTQIYTSVNDTLAATNANTINTIVKRDGSGNFNAGIITATLNGNATTATSAINSINLSGSLVGDVTGTQGSTIVSNVGGKTSTQISTSVNDTLAATNLNTVSTIVKRDTSGNFSAGTITGSLSGNATTATTAGNVSGIVAAVNGGTGQSTFTLGDTVYSSATNTLSKLSGNITTNKLYYSQTGSGTISAAPIWGNITTIDTGDNSANTDYYPITSINSSSSNKVIATVGSSFRFNPSIGSFQSGSIKCNTYNPNTDADITITSGATNRSINLSPTGTGTVVINVPGMKFTNSTVSYVPTALSYYEETSIPLGGSGASSIGLNFYLVRCGSAVTISWAQTGVFSTTAAGSIAYNAIPARFRPGQEKRYMYQVTQGGAGSVAVLTIASTGVITFYNNAGGGNFGSGVGGCNLQGTSITFFYNT